VQQLELNARGYLESFGAMRRALQRHRVGACRAILEQIEAGTGQGDIS
jgi:hypothetical protein